jgi:hypothetical protein
VAQTVRAGSASTPAPRSRWAGTQSLVGWALAAFAVGRATTLGALLAVGLPRGQTFGELTGGWDAGGTSRPPAVATPPSSGLRQSRRAYG